MQRFLLLVALAIWGYPAPISAAGNCDVPTQDRPDHCPSDDRIAALDQAMLENHVFFPRGGAGLDDDATAQIALLARLLDTQAMAGVCLKLVGHSDSSGGTAANAALSERRAEAVRAALESELGTNAPPIVVEAMGEDDLLPDLPTTHVAQRRVTLWAKACDAG
ncbi:MAG: OmpA family protein [Pseudomonadota bacterium]